MCFRNLPIEFDDDGKAHLAGDFRALAESSGDGVLTQEKILTLLKQNGHVQEYNVDPVTRVAGALAFHTVVDLEQRKVLDASSVATLFRGYELILKGRDPRDAIYISSRACGVCGGVHSVTAAMALEMAFGVKPPPMGVVVRNLGLAAEFLYDHPLHLFLLAGPDYSEQVVRQTTPALWERAQKTSAPGQAWHGYSRIADIMRAMNPLTGELYLEALAMTRVAREAYVILHAKYPHPQTIVPGGVTSTITHSSFNEYHARLLRFFDYAKKVSAIWDDLTGFFYEADARYREVGSRPMNLIDTGMWDDPESYDATYQHCNEWGQKRWATPGVIVNGELVTTRLQDINIGVEEFVEHSFYADWTPADRSSKWYAEDPLGAPLSPYHMWNKETKPQPGRTSWKDKYSWSTAPRWDRMAMETGPYSRMWITAMAKSIPDNPYIEATGHSLVLNLPKSALPAVVREWQVPEVWGALERNRGRAYAIAYTAMVAMNELERAWNYMRAGEVKVHTPFTVPQDERLGVGFWGAGRGYLTHHVIMDKGVIQNYQIVTPSTWMASPRDPFGRPGPYEEAVLNTPILEERQGTDRFQGIDILRTIRSFDPCMPCTTHIFEGDQLVLTREVNTCGCGLDE